MSDLVNTNEPAGQHIAPGRRSGLDPRHDAARGRDCRLVSLARPEHAVGTALPLRLRHGDERSSAREGATPSGWSALALYLPPAVLILFEPFEWWGDYLEHFSCMPTFIPAELLGASCRGLIDFMSHFSRCR